jgi:hypothetical protein
LRWFVRCIDEGRGVSLLKAQLALSALAELRARDRESRQGSSSGIWLPQLHDPRPRDNGYALTPLLEATNTLASVMSGPANRGDRGRAGTSATEPVALLGWI